MRVGIPCPFRYGDDVNKSTTHPESIEILLVWRSVATPDEAVRTQELDAFQKEFANVLDWSTATIEHGEVLLHT